MISEDKIRKSLALNIIRAFSGPDIDFDLLHEVAASAKKHGFADIIEHVDFFLLHLSELVDAD